MLGIQVTGIVQGSLRLEGFNYRSSREVIHGTALASLLDLRQGLPSHSLDAR